MLGNLPEVEISELNKVIINIITSMVDKRVFSSVFPQESETIAKMLI